MLFMVGWWFKPVFPDFMQDATSFAEKVAWPSL